jgi:hypothetical protein
MSTRHSLVRWSSKSVRGLSEGVRELSECVMGKVLGDFQKLL